MIDTILLVPADGDPHGLLADGACGARPPALTGYACNDATHGRWWPENAEREAPVCPECSARKRWCDVTALVLAYRGKPVAEGCDRANRALIAATDGDFGGTLDYYDDGYPLRRIDLFVRLLGGRAVFLDADGREVTRA